DVGLDWPAAAPVLWWPSPAESLRSLRRPRALVEHTRDTLEPRPAAVVAAVHLPAESPGWELSSLPTSRQQTVVAADICTIDTEIGDSGHQPRFQHDRNGGTLMLANQDVFDRIQVIGLTPQRFGNGFLDPIRWIAPMKL